jgi:hypothetical protein
MHFSPPREMRSECPGCGIWFHKWNAPLPEPAPVAALPIEEEEPLPAPDALTYHGRVAVLALVAVWGVFLAAADYRSPRQDFDFMHAILLPIHEAGHVFLMPFGELPTIAGGSFLQVALPLAIAIAFRVKQRDPFGAAVCLWWAGASVVDLAPYIYDALDPKLILLGGHTGEDGPHDWIYLLSRLGSLRHAHGWGTGAHLAGVLVMIGSVVWAASWLWKMAPWRRGL